MNLFLWALQGVLAAVFAMAGLQKISQPREKLVGNLPWVENFSQNTVRFIGAVELLAAIGLVLPAATAIAAVLAPLAATGLVVLMLLAMNTHRRRHEPGVIVFNAALLLAAAVVAWGRFGPHAF